MGVIEFKLKTHSRENLTSNYPDLNNCIVHNRKPVIEKIVAGRHKDVHFIATCNHDDCGKISHSADAVVAAWNRWNPKNELSNTP
jgi:hypothetical protein